MHTIDWMMPLLPVAAIIYIAWRVRNYTKGVSGFLAGNRLAGRYVLVVASGEAGGGLITAVAFFEKYYQSGYAIAFWQQIAMPVGLLMTLTGFVVYRYRETRALTLAQFFEIRYSKRFRVFAGVLSYAAGVINYAIFPAVTARFIIFYGGLPTEVAVGGFMVPMFPLMMIASLAVAMSISLLGGQLSIMVTDCVLGIFNYFVYVIIVGAILLTFSFSQFRQAMESRGDGESFINPFNIGDLQDFNLLFVLIGIFMSVYGRMAWQGGQGFNAAAKNAHEQKMAGVLGTWKNGFNTLMFTLLAICAFTYLHHPDFAVGADAVHTELAARVHTGNEVTDATLRNQLLVPLTIREFLPTGIVGLFLTTMMLAMFTCDTSYLHSWGSILIQDIVLPFRKKPFEEKQQLMLLRLSILGVAVFAFLFSLFYGQTTYILMFMSLTGALYLGGAGAVIIGGLYWSRGTSAGAWAAMASGVTVAAVGFFCTHNWAGMIYPWLLAAHPGFLEGFKDGLEWLGALLPIASWTVTPKKFPITGQEIMFLTAGTAITAYVTVSLLTCRERFNLDRMLHRGEYRLAAEDTGAMKVEVERKRSWVQRFLGFNEEYTKGDRILAWSVFYWTMGNFAVFVVAVVWNLVFGRWSDDTWFEFWKYYAVGLVSVVALVTTVWFTIGGVVDLRRLFRSLETFHADVADDGRVIGHTNADEVKGKAKGQGGTRD